ncbi:MAG: hypothetical protein NTV45_03885 [Firmicutes bacterium]|nr:hypothetical protein [Bacillota bacterium]
MGKVAMLILLIIVSVFFIIIGIVIGTTIADRIESPEFKSAKSNAFDMVYYESMSKKYSATKKKELDSGNNTEYLLAADKEARFRYKKAKSEDAFEADAAKLSEREFSRLDKYIAKLEDKSDALKEIDGK